MEIPYWFLYPLIVLFFLLLLAIEYLFLIWLDWRRVGKALGGLDNRYMIMKSLSREATYLRGVYKFQTETLKQAPPEIRHEVSDQLSQFVNLKKKAFWDMAHAANML